MDYLRIVSLDNFAFRSLTTNKTAILYLRSWHALCYVQSFECCACLDNQLCCQRNFKLISHCKYDICKLSCLANGDIRFTYAATV